jgi:hypothetical protein
VHSDLGAFSLQQQQRLQQLPHWQLPHPWQVTATAAAAAAASKHRSSTSTQQQQQQQLEVALLEWECCSQQPSRGGESVLAFDGYGDPGFAAAFVERRWRQQADMAALQQIDPEVGGRGGGQGRRGG